MPAELELISGGYCLARPTRRLEWIPPALPEFVLSGSGCLTDFVDENGLTGCMPHTEAEMIELGQQMGCGIDGVRAIQDLIYSLALAGEFRYPRHFITTAAARRVVPMLGRCSPGLTLFGMSTRPHHAAAIIAGPNAQRTYEAVLARNQAPEPGEVLGWDILGTDYADFHSWFCTSTETVAEIGVPFNAHGFVDSLEDAHRVADYCNQPNHAEPGYYAPWQIRRYSM